MKQYLEDILEQTFKQLIADEIVPPETEPRILVERTKDKQHGDMATNLAMVLAKSARKKPRDLAEAIVARLPAESRITKVEIAGPGFINFFLDAQSQFAIIPKILQETTQYGRSTVGKSQKVQVEFVSANPTGPLHVGHGRGAAYGATVANLLEAAGFDVHREYYVNDAGRQMNILGTSVFLRYLEALGESFTFPSNGYKGDYINDIAKALIAEHGETHRVAAAAMFENVSADEPAGGDKEAHIDDLVSNAQQILGDHYSIFFDAALNGILDDIRDDLSEFGVNYEEWFSEKSLTGEHIEKAVATLKANGHIYEKDGAQWFKSTAFGDDKDRVVIRDNGQSTYFASDIAYHLNKFERGFDQVINVWGADHHGYIARVMAALEALGLDPTKLKVLLVQFAILYRGGEKVQMSTRSGQFVTLRELREEVGNDAARFFYVTRKSEQHMDFDLDLAKSESKDNPVFYLQYAHARACSLLRKCAEHGWTWDSEAGQNNLTQLSSELEIDLTAKLSQYPEVVEKAALQHEPHLVSQYLRELAQAFHSWYNTEKMLVEESDLRNARLTLSEAARQVINNGLTLLGVSAPESM